MLGLFSYTINSPRFIDKNDAEGTAYTPRMAAVQTIFYFFYPMEELFGFRTEKS